MRQRHAGCARICKHGIGFVAAQALWSDPDRLIVEHLDLTQARRPGHALRRITVDFPVWVIAALHWIKRPRG